MHINDIVQHWRVEGSEALFDDINTHKHTTTSEQAPAPVRVLPDTSPNIMPVCAANIHRQSAAEERRLLNLFYILQKKKEEQSLR